ncbi:ABC transporter ATP-binding protein [Paracoccus shanxieyensis]|uniref:ATP-binding cassette domain-containing protein n=1 Tax=Paracoccus shanxieyensis TaxID=2675752 RepID=A0A6L6J7P5_9RHOB|nr:ABC transporter ATP-binding protein [Paracoccus shanxieyensis]MTH66674.1 ATP-binding cassette domain-containing protein [Paracoccus shanxieyensis]MTH89909.1 ATP-binding cassette domain-containing protein [Paracoccus shanxieyensis]
MSSSLTLRSLSKRYDDVTIVNSVSFDVAEGEFVSLLGPSGCGKTTILRMIAGLLEPSGGQILFGDQDVTRLPANKRNIGLVFQSYALFPHMTVYENVAYGLRRQKVTGRELDARVMEALARVRLDQHAKRFPRQLSGGQQQRVALARSIAPRPSILLFDEPLSNLDAQLREEMQIEIKKLQADLKLTSLFVTHDQHEAMSLSDRICLMSGGNIQQLATPEDVYFQPANGFVSGFVGSPNKIEGSATSGGVRFGSGAVIAANVGFIEGAPVRATIRQEDVTLRPGGVGPLTGTIALRIFEGANVQYVVALTGGDEILARVSSRSDLATLAKGTPVALDIPADRVFLSPGGAAA